MNLPIGRFLVMVPTASATRCAPRQSKNSAARRRSIRCFPIRVPALLTTPVPKDCIHIENLGGESRPRSSRNKRLIVGCFRGSSRRRGPHSAAPSRSWRMDDLADRSPRARRLVASREVSPVEVVEACLDGSSATTPPSTRRDLNPRALDDAGELELRLVRGEEVGLARWACRSASRTSTPVAGLRTTLAPRSTGTTYRPRMRWSCGGCGTRARWIIGKTNCPEFRRRWNTFNEVFGRTRNPWDPTAQRRWLDGRRRGGLVTGNDHARRGDGPGRVAAYSRVVLRRRRAPTVGRARSDVSVGLGVGHAPGRGPHGAYRGDVALMLQAVAGPSRSLPSASHRRSNFVAAAARGIPQGLRVAYCPDIAGIGIDPAIERVCRAPSRARRARRAKSRRSTSTCLRRKGVPRHCAGCGLSRRCSANGASSTGSEPTSRVTFAPARATTRELGAAEAARGRMWHLSATSSGSSTTCSPVHGVPPFPVDQNYPETWPVGKWRRTWTGIAPTFVLSLSGLPVASCRAGSIPTGCRWVCRSSASRSARRRCCLGDPGRRLHRSVASAAARSDEPVSVPIPRPTRQRVTAVTHQCATIADVRRNKEASCDGQPVGTLRSDASVPLRRGHGIACFGLTGSDAILEVNQRVINRAALRAPVDTPSAGVWAIVPRPATRGNCRRAGVPATELPKCYARARCRRALNMRCTSARRVRRGLG